MIRNAARWASVQHSSVLGDWPVLDGLYAFYDADNTDSVIASGGFVSAWNDLSGNGNHLTETYSAPQTGLDIFNGRNTLRFTDNHLHRNSYLSHPFDMTQYTVLFVSSLTTWNTNRGLVCVHNGLSTGTYYPAPGGYDWDNPNAFSFNTATAPFELGLIQNQQAAHCGNLNTSYTMCVTFGGRRATGALHVRRRASNGVWDFGNVAAPGPSGASTATGGILVGARYSAGGINQRIPHANFGLIAIWDRELTTTEEDDVIAHAEAMFGLTYP